MSATITEQPIALKPAKPQVDLQQSLENIASQANNRRQLLDTAFQMISNETDVIWGMLEAQIGGRTFSREFARQDMDTSMLSEFALTLAEEAQMDTVSRARMIPSPTGDFVAVACPLVEIETELAIGTMTFFLSVENRDAAKKQLARYEQVTALVSQLYDQRFYQQQATPTHEPPAELRAVVNSAKYENLDSLCFALVNSYCEKLGCQRTAIGLVQNNQVKIRAISGLDSIVENSPAIVEIKQAQEECLDFDQRVVVQHQSSEEPTPGLLIHEQWLRSSSAGAVASIPIQTDGNTIAVFSLERAPSCPFSKEELDQIEATIQAFGPAIALMKKSTRALRDHVKEDVHERLIKPFKNRIVKTTSAVVLAVLLLGWLPYRPTLTCTIQPAKVHHLVAPYDAALASAPLFAGDEVKAGQTIMQMDTRELELKRDSLLAGIHAKEISRNHAIVRKDKIAAAIADAEIDAMQVELQSIERKIDQGQLRAQFDGLIIRGDLRQRIGQTIPKGTAMFELAPTTGMRVQLEIPESKAGLIKVGHEGYFAAETRPGDSHRFRITKITPSTQVIGGQNVVLAEAEVEGDSEWMRAGMKGYANVRTGWQPVWWIVGHGAIDGLRLGFWL